MGLECPLGVPLPGDDDVSQRAVSIALLLLRDWLVLVSGQTGDRAPTANEICGWGRGVQQSTNGSRYTHRVQLRVPRSSQVRHVQPIDKQSWTEPAADCPCLAKPPPQGVHEPVHWEARNCGTLLFCVSHPSEGAFTQSAGRPQPEHCIPVGCRSVRHRLEEKGEGSCYNKIVGRYPMGRGVQATYEESLNPDPEPQPQARAQAPAQAPVHTPAPAQAHKLKHKHKHKHKLKRKLEHKQIRVALHSVSEAKLLA